MKLLYRSRLLLKGLNLFSAIKCMSGLKKFTDGKGVENFFISYRKFGKRLKVEVRGKHFQSDLQSVLELAAGDCYHLSEFDWRPETIIDAGGNTGLFSLAANALWPEAAIKCFEPVPGNVELISKHVASNAHVGKIEIIPSAVGSETKRATFFVRDANQGSLDSSLEFGETIDVEVLRLWDIYAKLSPGKVLIKLDIEGAEFDVLYDFFKNAPLQKTVFVMEVHGGKKEQDQLLEKAEHAGFVGKFWERASQTAHLYLASKDVGYVMHLND
jgi:FkbM family methyltransferase